MLASERVLGPRWSQKELRTFFILLKAYGKQWDRIEERLPSRTNAMIRALFDMHRGYLSLPEASAEGFCTIMTDHYKSMDELQSAMDSASSGDASMPIVSESPEPASMNKLIQELATTSMTPKSSDTSRQSKTSPVDTPPTKSNDGVTSDTRSKKKRKLEKFLARDEQVDADETMDNHQDGADPTRFTRRSRARKSLAASFQPWVNTAKESVPTKSRQLPWYYWFCSAVDVEFFGDNEFIDCLERMQLGNLIKAARPIWSSVRASMGHPRRLSQRFLAEEKRKLHEYRRMKRADDGVVPTDWPFRSPVPIATGVRVLAQLSHPRRFVKGTIENFSLREDVCKVRLDNNGSRVCTLDCVMLLTDPRKDQENQPGRKEKQVRSVSRLSTSRDEASEQVYQDKLAAVALVKDLLKRKELIVNAMTKMNTQARILRHEFTSNSFVADATMTDEALFQRQYAWLVVNLDVTNRFLRAALLRLQDVSQLGRADTNATVSTASASVTVSHQQPSTRDDPSTMLTLDHMRWAVNFLALSRKKSSELVNDMASTAASIGSQEDVQETTISPAIKELIANCLSLATVFRKGSSTSIPPLITQKLMDRMFELLEPQFEANMDLYAELRSAAEGFTVLHQQQARHVGGDQR